MPKSIVGGISSIFGGSKRKKGIQQAIDTQTAAGEAARGDLRTGAKSAFDVFKSQAALARSALSAGGGRAIDALDPFREGGLKGFEAAIGLLDPNSEQSQAEREQFQQVLAKNLSARGLTASGAEIAGLTQFEIGQGQGRRGLALGLANIGAGAAQQIAGLEANIGVGLANIFSQEGQVGAGIQSQLGSNLANIGLGTATNIANLQVGKGEAAAQQIFGVGNAIQSDISDAQEIIIGATGGLGAA